MRHGIVKRSTIGKYNRMDAPFFLGDGGQLAEEVRKAEENLVRAKQRVARAHAARAEAQAKADAMAASGEVIIIRRDP